MAYDIKNTKVIYLGRQGENLARTIEIDVSSMLMKWPDATISLLVQRNQEDTFYLAPVVIENGILKWTITNADTEIAGIGKIEVRAIQDDAIMKSATMKICVENSLGGTETVVPDPVQTWVDTIVAASVQAKQSAEDALASELAAKEAAESIAKLESNIEIAEAARVEAEKERISAENERESAETSRETAENNRVAAETARVTAEQSRASAETARESAETDRQTTFETNEAQRQTAFETAEAGRAAAESSRVAAEESRVSAEAGRVEAESERVTAENQRAETFAGYETRIDAATPDDSTVDGKPWTSRKIVDTLCPPFDVSGSAVTCHPVERYPLDVVSRIDATQSGTGDPSPDNIRPIVGWDSVTVTRCGKNLLNPEKNAYITYNPYGLTVTYIGDNKVHLSGIYNQTGGSFFAILDTTQKSLAGRNLKVTGFTIDGTKQSYTLYGLRTKDETTIAMNAQFVEGDVIDMTVAIVVSQDTPSAYEPYTGTTATLSLPSTVYGGEVDLATGEGVETWACLVLDGTESWGAYTNPANNGFQYSLNTDVNLPLIKQGDNRVCTHFSTSNFKYWSQLVANNFATNEYYIRVQSLIPTLDEWKSYLAAQVAAGTPVTIAYKLVTPTAFQATGAQSLPALPGTNTIYTDADSVTVSGRADPNHIIQTLSDRIAALENETIEGGTNA